ncbi:MAG: hypothetical protein JWR16_869 [Nevskia sp.]|nr:hypothetical protein [Nevskia sp.]
MKPETYSTDYTMWRLLAWCGPIFMTVFFFMWGVFAGNLPPAGADLDAAQITAHYLNNGMAIRIGMSVCMVGSAFYMAWGCAVSKVMRRIEGPDGILSNLEMMGATITCAPLLVACGIWLTASIEAPQLPPAIIHMMYWLGWMIIDIAYMVTTFQIFAVGIVFLRDQREKPLMPAWISWWGFVTCAAFFPVSLIPFFKTGPFAFHGLFNFWIAFFTWYIWVTAVSFNIIRAISRLQQEDGAASPSAAQQRAGVLITG